MHRHVFNNIMEPPKL